MRDLEREFAEGHISLNEATQAEEEQLVAMKLKADKGPYYTTRLKLSERHHRDLSHAVVNGFGVVVCLADCEADAKWIAQALNEQFRQAQSAG